MILRYAPILMRWELFQKDSFQQAVEGARWVDEDDFEHGWVPFSAYEAQDGDGGDGDGDGEQEGEGAGGEEEGEEDSGGEGEGGKREGEEGGAFWVHRFLGGGEKGACVCLGLIFLTTTPTPCGGGLGGTLGRDGFAWACESRHHPHYMPFFLALRLFLGGKSRKVGKKPEKVRTTFLFFCVILDMSEGTTL